MRMSQQPLPRMDGEQRKLVETVLTDGCRCGAETATLRRRRINGHFNVYLQCDQCGGSLCAGRRDDHFFWQTYPEWDEELRERYWAQKATAFDAERAAFNARLQGHEEERQRDYEKRRQDYQAWLLTTEWRTLRAKVLDRAGGRCEACLEAQATEVHHLSYVNGRAPPAWELRAVCRSCHERLHDWQGTETTREG